MKLNVVIARKIFSVFNGSQIMTRNMREPATPILGWVARTLMQNGNARVAASSVQQLHILKTDSVCEVGAGSGLSLLALRREILDAEWFVTTKQAQTAINAWLKQYNHIRPHQALNMRPPVPETLLRNGTEFGGWTRSVKKISKL